MEKKQDNQNPILNEGLILHMIENGMLSKETLGIDDRKINKIYERAKQLYESGLYQQARQVFSMLTILENKNPSFLYGLASSAMMLNDTPLAINAFLEYAALVPNDPTPYYYSASCYEKNHDTASTLISLQAAVNVAKDQPQFQGIKQRALLAIDNYKKNSEGGKH